MKHIKLLLIISIIFFSSITVYAHPGATDEYGGHVDWENGEYHYHHGYEAHQHTNGVCPYNFVDNADHSSAGSGNTSNSYDYNYGNREPYLPEQQYPLVQKENTNNDSIFSLIVGIILTVVLYVFIYGFAYNWDKKRKERKSQTHSEHEKKHQSSPKEPSIPEMIDKAANEYNARLKEKQQAEQRAQQKALREEQQRKSYEEYIRREEEKLNHFRQQREQERQRYIDLYSGKTAEELAGVPDGITFDEKGLPHKYKFSSFDNKYYDAYTVKIAKNGSPIYHRTSCEYGSLIVNYTETFNKKYTACKVCFPMQDDISWYQEYIKIKQIKEKYNIN